MKFPLVCISGLLSNEHVWQHQVKHLKDVADIQIFSPTQNRPSQMVDAILRSAPPKFSLAGHSMGGWLSLEIMRVAPSRVTKLCLLNTSARGDSQEKRARRQEMIERTLQGQFKEIVEEIIPFFTHNILVREAVKQMFLEVGGKAFVSQEEAMMERKPCDGLLPKIQCPTLVIHAAQDRNFSLEEHLELANQIPDAKLAIVEDSGHMSPMEMPQAVSALLRYWLTYF